MKMISVLLLSCLAVTSCKRQPVVQDEQPVVKKVVFQVYSEKDYANGYKGTPWEFASAEVRLWLEQYNSKTNQTVVVWDTVFVNRRLSTYPMQADKYVMEKEAPVLESAEVLIARQETVIALSAMEPQRSGSRQELPKGTNSYTLRVAL